MLNYLLRFTTEESRYLPLREKHFETPGLLAPSLSLTWFFAKPLHRVTFRLPVNELKIPLSRFEHFLEEPASLLPQVLLMTTAVNWPTGISSLGLCQPSGFIPTLGRKNFGFREILYIGGEQGSADLARDVRGFAVKLYTKEGNRDIVVRYICGVSMCIQTSFPCAMRNTFSI